MSKSVSESMPFTLVSLIDQASRFLIRLVNGISADSLRYSDAQRLIRSLNRAKIACDTKLALLEEAR